MVGRQADLVVLSDTDRNFFESQVRRHKAPRSLWVKSADQILASVKRFCQKTMDQTSNSGEWRINLRTAS
ncbi:hypothetical protein [Agrobacterium radiobacter]|uniref:hypothetical protein n=1 Tax=Agrobacterium radiobacter TaxID=362 RepID=UPI003CE54CF2